MTDEQWQAAWKLYQSSGSISGEQLREFLNTATRDGEVRDAVLAMFEGTSKTGLDRIGQTIGGYVITGRLGQGGMGEVFAARDSALGRPAAVKLLTAQPAGAAPSVDRFIHEAKAASALNHPNIVTIYEVVNAASGLGIVMELVDGMALRQLCGSPLPVDRVVHLGEQIARALAAAHARGIVHCDIKPENLMVRPDGFVKVMDFGLARDLGSMDTNSFPAAGTLRYMSPEQSRGEAPSPASDIFSLGLVLYELAAGKHPFDSGSIFETLKALNENEPVPPSSVNAFVPGNLDALILRMLAKDASHRPAAAEVARALESRLTSQLTAFPAWEKTEGPPLPSRQKTRRMLPRILPWMGAAAVFGLVALWAMYFRPAKAAPETRLEMVVPTTDDRASFALSPDGRRIAFAAFDGGSRLLSVRALDSTSAQPLPGTTQNQYGLNGGGPIKKNKTFIFMAWEEFIQRVGTTTNFTVPTAAERAGDFSNLRTATGALIPIYDPATTCTTCPAGQQRTPFAGNVIPGNRFDKTAAIMEQFWPLPNAAGAPFTGANNYLTNYNTPLDRNWENLRIDQNVSSKQRIFGSFNRWNNIQPPIDPYSQGISFYMTQNAHEGMLADTYTLNPTTVLDARIGYTRHEYTRTPTNLGLDLTTIGWPSSLSQQLLISTLPVIGINGFSSSNGGQTTTMSAASIQRQFAGVGYVAGSVTKIIGRHTIKFGGEYQWLPTTYGASVTSSFAFTSNFTAANPLSPGNTGNSFASYLLGLGSSGTVGNTHVPLGTQHAGGLYVGDTFQVSKRLTLNLGVRWEYTGYWSERHDLETVFLPGATNPVLASAGLNYKGDVVLVDSSRYPYNTQLIPHWGLFSPRFGTAYRLTDKTVARMGFGTSYVPGTPSQYLEPYTMPINTAKTPWVPTQNNGLTPVATLNNPFPTGIAQVPGRNSSYESSALGSSIVSPVPGDATPYIMNWNVGFERQLGATDMIEVGYVGTRGVHQRMGGDATPPSGGPNLNQIPTQDLALGSQLLTPVTNPFYGLVPTGPLAQPTVPYGQLLLPYPQYTGVYSPSTAGFSDSFHSLEAKFQKRLKAGGTLLVTYAWSKNTGNGETLNGHTEVAPPGITQNYYNWSAEHSLMSYDVPHRLSVSYVVDLPIGKGRRFLGNVTGVADKLISGWGVNGVTTLQSGFPVPLTAQPTSLSTNFGAGTPRPNVALNCDKTTDGSSQSRLSQWFNTTCFSQPSTFGFGDEARTDPNIRSAGIANYDFTLFKNTHLTERIGLQFRVEAFNLFNRVQFGPPGTVLGTPQFGVVSTQINDPRLIQVAMRLSF